MEELIVGSIKIENGIYCINLIDPDSNDGKKDALFLDPSKGTYRFESGEVGDYTKTEVTDRIVLNDPISLISDQLGFKNSTK